MSSIFFEDLIDNLDLQKEYVEPINLASSFFPLSYSKAKDMGCMNFFGPSVDYNNIMYLKNDTNLQSTFDLIMIQFYGQPYPNYTEIADALEMDIGTLMNLEKEYQIERLRLIKSRCPTEKKI